VEQQKSRIYIREFVLDDAESLLKLNVENREIFEAITPISKDDSFYTLEAQLQLIEDWKRQGNKGIVLILDYLKYTITSL